MLMSRTVRVQPVASVAAALIGLTGTLALVWVVRREPLALPPLVIAVYALVGLLIVLPVWRTAVTRRAAGYPLLAVAALAVGYGALALRGGLRFDAPRSASEIGRAHV